MKRAKRGDVGIDIVSAESAFVKSQSVTVVRTSVRVTPPPGYFYKVEGRSGLASNGVFPVGGIIDPGYTGEVRVALANLGLSFDCPAGTKIAQLVLYAVGEDDYESGEQERGEDGFGSTGL